MKWWENNEDASETKHIRGLSSRGLDTLPSWNGIDLTQSRALMSFDTIWRMSKRPIAIVRFQDLYRDTLTQASLTSLILGRFLGLSCQHSLINSPYCCSQSWKLVRCWGHDHLALLDLLQEWLDVHHATRHCRWVHGPSIQHTDARERE